MQTVAGSKKIYTAKRKNVKNFRDEEKKIVNKKMIKLQYFSQNPEDNVLFYPLAFRFIKTSTSFVGN